RHTRFSRDWSSDVCSSDLRRSVAGACSLRGRGTRSRVPGSAEGQLARVQSPAHGNEQQDGQRDADAEGVERTLASSLILEEEHGSAGQAGYHGQQQHENDDFEHELLAGSEGLPFYPWGDGVW